MFFIINLFSLLSFITISNGQTPPLGSTSTFAVFTAVGAINNTGFTVVTGDLGTNAGAYNGFPPGIVNGGVYIEDPISALAAIDVQIAYEFFAAVPCGSTIGTTLGNGQSLTPDVYCIGAASTLVGDLTLDAEGNPDAIFIFKIDGAFSTSVSANIILANSAAICNIYWQINGQITIGNFSNFYGTVLNNGAESLLNNSVIQGRLLSIAGEISLSTSFVENVCSAALPIKLVSFAVICKDQKAHLNWTTAQEINNDYFTIERSNNTRLWEEIGSVQGNGNSSADLHYRFIDDVPNIHSNYYRFKQVDYDGKYSFSDVIHLRDCRNLESNIDIFPNPVNGKINIVYNVKDDKFIDASVFNSIGAKIYHSVIQESTIDLTNEKNGIYLLHIKLSSGLIIKKITVLEQ